MNKAIKWGLIILGSLTLVLIIALTAMRTQTKKHSPEDTVQFVEGERIYTVFYNRPFKKGREIFGGLLPYGKVWRTGANEATTFTTNQDLMIDGQLLPEGKYTLWTIPEENQWTVIFNGKDYSWGVNMRGEASRDPASDVVKVAVPATQLPEIVEQFTISFEKGYPPNLVLAWDRTQVSVPLPMAK